LGNDTLSGGNGNDYINAYGSILTNDKQYDRLTGEAGSDTFVLGEKGKVFYNETGNGYAVIQDWKLKLSSASTEFDRIHLAGNASQYKLEFTSVSGIGTNAKDTSILLRSNNSWERISIAQDTANVSFNRDAVFV
jgi:RTX calcium-binding nonapeptide repeat (4 copies)